MSFGLRRIAREAPRLVGRPWNDVAPELQRLLEDLLTGADEGLPAGGDHGTTPAEDEVGGAGDPGDESGGWAPANHSHPHTRGTPVAIALANADGASGEFSDAEHVHASGLTTNGDLLTVVAGVLARLGAGGNGALLEVASSLPAWLAAGAEGSLLRIVSGLPAWTLAGIAWTKYTKTHTDLQAAALTNTIELFSLPAKSVILAVYVKHSVAFAGGAIAAYTVSVGIVGNLTKYTVAFDVFQAVSDTTFQLTSVVVAENHGSATSIKLTATSVGANLDQSTAGSVDVWVLWSTLP